MNAADTRASRAIAAWMALTSVPRSATTAEIETFMIDVSTTSTNIAIANRMASRLVPGASTCSLAFAPSDIFHRLRSVLRWRLAFSESCSLVSLAGCGVAVATGTSPWGTAVASCSQPAAPRSHPFRMNRPFSSARLWRSPGDDVEDVPMLRAEERIPVLVLLVEREELEAIDEPAHGIDVDESHTLPSGP